MGVVDAAVVAVAAVFWAVTAYKLVELRRRPTPAQQALTLTLGALAVTATLLTSLVHNALGDISGIANLAEPLARSALLVAAFAAQVLLLRITVVDHDDMVRRRVVVLLGTVVALWFLFVVSPVDTGTVRFTHDYGDHPLVAGYLVTSLAYLSWALVDIARGARRYAAAGRRWLTTSLRLIMVGCGFGLAYVAAKVVALAGLMTGRPLPVEVEATVGRSLAVAAGTLVVVGAVLPAVGAGVDTARSWATAHRDLRRLHPLWVDLLTVHPELALEPPRPWWRDLVDVRDVEMRLYRRVIEIRDGRLALRGSLDAEVRDEALGGAQGAAAGEAAMIADAIAHAADGAKPVRAADGEAGGGNWEEDLRWLRSVAEDYRRRRLGGVRTPTAHAEDTA